MNNYQELNQLSQRIRDKVSQGYQLPEQPIQRVPLPPMAQAPMLVNERTVSSSSSLEMWERDLDERLEMIDKNISNNKNGAAELNKMFASGKLDEMEF
ncbi:hypothetical protein RNJ44_03571 [Nakaseomyces bracarensis]|uniref:Uncharacterized protein n=1 Tax=Nakaseomyces bracarensis TaxID=273131 RepID=A0ABR4NXC7_9SACH